MSKPIDPATAAALAAFKARGGTVTRIETGASSGVTDRQWYAASQGKIDLRSRLNGGDEERAAERYAETFRETRHAGGSVSEALDDASEARWLARMAGDMEA